MFIYCSQSIRTDNNLQLEVFLSLHCDIVTLFKRYRDIVIESSRQGNNLNIVTLYNMLSILT